ncbi:type IV pilus modification PilV family protein [Kineococcus rhizosphaerae]|uniref:Prepilin-type N-terminal cleavage/methylation domain-containing protein n=1 Tax=Kineococcus rhizosphaerae TaxID=559628 RepID=A0A2T0R9S0_9ACTN|nr:prepilin-type N-terminal cleavage/methylation domain-containing protein [Kineococcus rhizosphaerae]PRY17907.1 prepilin-type N-terminal cleavage/methylation domain-containing protein [Kineococcus rhizosphaerae]
METQQEPRRDEGFSLIEVVVSMLIFAVLSSAVLGLVVKTLQTTSKADGKAAAANLADAKKEYLIGAAWDSVVSGTDVVDADGTPWAAGQGTAYTVATTVANVPNTSSPCATNGAELTRKLITVGVTWTGMAAGDQVTNRTFRRIYQSDSANTPGSIAWQLNTPAFAADGTVSYSGLSGVTAKAYDSTGTLAGTGVSDGTGCVVVSDLDAGTYSVVVDKDDYVGQDNVQQQSANVSVNAGKISVPAPIRYASVAAAKLNLVPVTGYPAPSSSTGWTALGTTFFADTLSGYDRRPACASGADPLTSPCAGYDGTLATVGRFYPRSYSAYLGACADVKASTVDFTPRATAADVPTVNVKLGAAKYQLTNVGNPLKTWKVVATHAAAASCSGQSIDLGTTAPGTARQVGLPLGTWTLTATPTTGVVTPTNTTSVTVTVTATAPASATTLAVVL